MKIGVFDSGLGGLTIVSSLLKKFSNLQVYYVADTDASPYGEKSQKEILEHSLQVTRYLIDNHNIDVLVVACNTATSAAIQILREKFPTITIIGIEPGIKPAIEISKTGHIGVLATNATLLGKKYRYLRDTLSYQSNVKLYDQACPGLVEQIEAGEINSNETMIMLQKWLYPMQERNVDTIVLGCTHYPLIKELIQKIMGKNIQLIETGNAIANRLEVLGKSIDTSEIGQNKVFVYATDNRLNKNVINTILDNWINGGQIKVR